MCCPHFCKSEWQKAKRMNKKTEGPVQLLFCLISVSCFKMVLFTKKKQFVCWELCFLVNTKNKGNCLICARNNFWLLMPYLKKTASAGLLLFLELVLKERQRQSKHFVFFLLQLTLLCCLNKNKKGFFEVVVFLFAS